jgi:hypothetical protein
MPLSTVKSPYFKSTSERYEQGDILRDVTLIQWADVEEDRAINVVERTLQYCVIVSQECDLEHDYNNRMNAEKKTEDKYLQSLLVCPAYPADSFKRGEHLKQLGLRMENINSESFKRVAQNNHARYHHLGRHDDFQVPELVVDFKHYMTVPRDILYREQFGPCYLATLEILFRDSLSGRFAHYLSRIGLPDEMASA